jgi:hypothetical protein
MFARWQIDVIFWLWATKKATHRNHPNHQIITFLVDGQWLMAL